MPNHSGRARPGLTIAEIARLAGVSAPTVSKVVNGRSEVGAETRALVEQVLHEHGYQHRKRAAKASALIELVFHQLAGVYPIEIIKGVERVADEHNLAVVVSESHGKQTPRRGWIEGVLRPPPNRRHPGVLGSLRRAAHPAHHGPDSVRRARSHRRSR